MPQMARATRRVSLSASPGKVAEGSPVSVTATLSSTLSSAVTMPLAVTRDTSEADDHGTPPGMMIPAWRIARRRHYHDDGRRRCRRRDVHRGAGHGEPAVGREREAGQATPALGRERTTVGRSDHEVPGTLRAVRGGASRGEDRCRRPECGRAGVAGRRRLDGVERRGDARGRWSICGASAVPDRAPVSLTGDSLVDGSRLPLRLHERPARGHRGGARPCPPEQGRSGLTPAGTYSSVGGGSWTIGRSNGVASRTHRRPLHQQVADPDAHPPLDTVLQRAAPTGMGCRTLALALRPDLRSTRGAAPVLRGADQGEAPRVRHRGRRVAIDLRRGATPERDRAGRSVRRERERGKHRRCGKCGSGIPQPRRSKAGTRYFRCSNDPHYRRTELACPQCGEGRPRWTLAPALRRRRWWQWRRAAGRGRGSRRVLDAVAPPDLPAPHRPVVVSRRRVLGWTGSSGRRGR